MNPTADRRAAATRPVPLLAVRPGTRLAMVTITALEHKGLIHRDPHTTPAKVSNSTSSPSATPPSTVLRCLRRWPPRPPPTRIVA